MIGTRDLALALTVLGDDGINMELVAKAIDNWPVRA